MIEFTNITDSPAQKFTIIGEAGEIIPIEMIYQSREIGWIMSVAYGDFSLTGIRIGVSPNILYNYNNLIPFGILCTSVDGFDPYYLDDFSTGRIKLYLLNALEVVEFGTVVK